MDIFFYSATTSECEKNCRYRVCSKRCIYLLKKSIGELKVLPEGSSLKTLSSMQLRSGDIIILYAQYAYDLEALLSIKDYFETFRIILIVKDEKIIKYGLHYLLNPRFTACIGHNLERVGSVIHKMAQLPSPTTFNEQQDSNHA